MDKVKAFEKELTYIKNPQIKLFAEKAIETLPDYFFEIPSSSTGKYHSNYALGESGLTRHVKACVRLAVECFRLEWYNIFTEDQKDLIIVALLLHDGAKSGIPQEKYTRSDHPLIVINYLLSQESLKNIISEKYFNYITEGIVSHMGAWNKSRDGIEIMPKPKTKAQTLIHWIDYICSRKMFEVNFDVEVIRE
jgi:hypothetical protein